jgi:hypothetical protein
MNRKFKKISHPDFLLRVAANAVSILGTQYDVINIVKPIQTPLPLKSFTSELD